ncbi:MAG: 30S ribosomal protein S8 [Candidatus Hydrogenedentes bacterium]|jgi:small subunit ribosomal protein S8|nr:30S ribosomal protein S8 [Candidatus Hydrogenedentota bacterium]
MSMSDPIADLLTRIRNALHAGFPSVKAPASRLKEEVCRVLKEEGFILEYARGDDGKQGQLTIYLKYTADRKPVIEGIARVSKPSLRTYAGSKKVPPVRSGLGISILTTSKGVMTGRQARRDNVGGEVLCKVW